MIPSFIFPVEFLDMVLQIFKIRQLFSHKRRDLFSSLYAFNCLKYESYKDSNIFVSSNFIPYF